jgi:hypothetical protein
MSTKGQPAPGPFAFLRTFPGSLLHHLRYNGPGITGSRDVIQLVSAGYDRADLEAARQGTLFHGARWILAEIEFKMPSC